MTHARTASEDIDDLSRRLVAVERENGDLLKLVVAARRLGEATTTREALAAIRDIVINVVGSEDFAIYLLEPDGILRWVSGMGCFGAVARHFRLDEGPLGRAVARRVVHVPEQMEAGLDHLDGWPLAAAVPLMLGDRIIGAVAVFRVLPHRDPLSPSADGEVLRLIGAQGAAALAIADLLARAPDVEPAAT